MSGSWWPSSIQRNPTGHAGQRYNTHLYRQNFLTCTSYSLAPPLLTCASELLTCASDLLTCASSSFSLTPHYFPTCACSTILLLIENVYSLSFHNAMILNLACYLNFIPPCLPQCQHLKSNSLLKLYPPCLPQCHHLKTNSLFKLYSPLPSTMPSSKIKLFV